jgi:hypothetical protein
VPNNKKNIMDWKVEEWNGMEGTEGSDAEMN